MGIRITDLPKNKRNNRITMTKEKKASNFATAVYIAKTHGNNISDEKLTSVAKAMKLKPKVLIKNYKSVVSINEIVGSLNTL